MHPEAGEAERRIDDSQPLPNFHLGPEDFAIFWARGVFLTLKTLQKLAQKSLLYRLWDCWLLSEVALEALVERDGARGTRTLTAFQPEDFKSSTSTISSSPHATVDDNDTIYDIERLFLASFTSPKTSIS